MIDHTLLDVAATPGQVAMFCGEAVELGVAAVCVAPNRLPLAFEDRLDSPVREVPHPAGDAVGERAASGRLAEEDALDVTLDGDAAALHSF